MYIAHAYTCISCEYTPTGNTLDELGIPKNPYFDPSHVSVAFHFSIPTDTGLSFVSVYTIGCRLMKSWLPHSGVHKSFLSHSYHQKHLLSHQPDTLHFAWEILQVWLQINECLKIIPHYDIVNMEICLLFYPLKKDILLNFYPALSAATRNTIFYDPA